MTSAPAVVQALKIRKLLQAVNLVELDSWEFNVFSHSKEHLIACVCQMFMQQGLCQSRVKISDCKARVV